MAIAENYKAFRFSAADVNVTFGQKAHFIPRQTNMDYLDQTIAVWQPYTDRPLTREDAREITHNVVGFFRVLREWADEERTSFAESKGGQDTNRTPHLRDKESRKEDVADFDTLA